MLLMWQVMHVPMLSSSRLLSVCRGLTSTLIRAGNLLAIKNEKKGGSLASLLRVARRLVKYVVFVQHAASNPNTSRPQGDYEQRRSLSLYIFRDLQAKLQGA